MSDEGEKTCPLCAEEMDLTDQQLKPCKCGYEICVWCWHHIMDMAEKDNTEGRCPACRTPYNKEKIVGTASKCERLVTGMSVEKKQKSQKGKTKTSEGRKQLGSMRVIQRNLVYIVGLPLNLADEDLLQQKEYFGQYGKVLKVSISRTAAGAIQQSANNTCSVYITYSKEEEAVRSIQSAHGFVLEGRPLRACFGTTKYCHAWLRNAPCTNIDCLYLHEFGPQEDSFTKDEIITAHTRNRAQQITGATNDIQRRSGNLLPPPADDYSNNSTSTWGKPIGKSPTNNPPNNMKVSPPNSSSGRPMILPVAASWGTRASNTPPLVANETTSNGPVKKHSEEAHSFHEKDNLEPLESMKKVTASETPFTSGLPSSNPSNQTPTTSPKDKNKNQKSERDVGISVTREPSDFVSDLQKKVADISISEAEQDLLSFNDQRLRDTEVITHPGHTQNPPLFSFPSMDQNLKKAPQNEHNIPLVNGYSSTLAGDSSLDNSSGHSYFHGTEGGKRQMGIFKEAPSTNGCHNTALDLGENSIISDILAMDFDPWDESLSSPQNLAKLLGESDKKPESYRVVSSSRKVQNNNQSRFSFAREDECLDQGSNVAPTLSNFGPGREYQNFSPDFVGDNNIYLDNKLSKGNRNGFSSFSFEESDHFARNYSAISENTISASRAHVSAPPGFSGPSRAPPPGFSSHERMEQPFDIPSGNRMFKPHQSPAPVNTSDLEFMDPAILAVGGRVPIGRLNSFENDARLQLLMRTSFSQQNPRFNELGDGFSYGIPSRNLSAYRQTNWEQPRSSVMSSGHWDSWNERQRGNDISVAELLRNERLGFNQYYSGHEDTKFRLPTSGHLYNRMFGI